MPGNHLFPCVAGTAPDHRVAVVFQTFGLGRITLLPFRIFVMRTVHVDDGLTLLIEKIGSRATCLDEDLGLRGQTEATGLEELEPVAFQVGLTLAHESSHVLGAWQRCRGAFHLGSGELQQDVAELLAVQQPVVEAG